MASLPGRITVEVCHGPALSACVDVVNASVRAMELIPEWHEQERAQLEQAIRRAGKALLIELNTAPIGTRRLT